MKLLVSNYDGTINQYKNDSIFKILEFNRDLKCIKKFIEDNIFIIATRRRTNSILNEISKYDIKYNYLISYDGLVCLDSRDNIIYANYLDNEFIKELELIDKNIIYNITKYDILDINNDTLNVIKLKVNVLNSKLFMKEIKELRIKYNLNVSFADEYNSFYITKKTNKDIALNKLINYIQYEINKNDIYTMGGSLSDLEMLKNNNGYCIKGSKLKYYDNVEEVKNIKQLIKKIK